MSTEGTILVADDEPHIRRILQFLLEQEGFEVLLAENGNQVISILDRETPDLILLDVMMPRMDGFTVLRNIRSCFGTSRIPVIMLTAKGDNEDKVKGLKGGANDYVTKPFNQEELLLRMSNMLESTRYQREANPLTGLPGNPAIERECQDRIESGKPYSCMYIDIDRFKSYNDYYGYARGDEAIISLARVLSECSLLYGDQDDFIGHVGGDDFMLVTGAEQSGTLACQITEHFDAGIHELHNPEDFEKGYLEVETRAGDFSRVPLITVTVALVDDTAQRFKHVGQLSDALAELKRLGKTTIGSVVAKDRRQVGQMPELTTSSGNGTKSP